MEALRGLALLLVLQVAGDAIGHGPGLPVPGPVIGMALLTLALGVPAVRGPVKAISDVLLANLSLLFVPAGVGVVTHLDVLSRNGGALVLSLVVSTWVGMAVTALVLKALLRSDQREPMPGAVGTVEDNDG